MTVSLTASLTASPTAPMTATMPLQQPEAAAVPSVPTQPGERSAADLPSAATGRRWRSSELFLGSPEIEIEHGAAIYRLRRTSLGKLILTK